MLKYTIPGKLIKWFVKTDLCCHLLQRNYNLFEEVLLKAGDAVFDTLRRPAAGARWMLLVGLGWVGAGLCEAGIVLILGRRDDIFWLAL